MNLIYSVPIVVAAMPCYDLLTTGKLSGGLVWWMHHKERTVTPYCVKQKTTGARHLQVDRALCWAGGQTATGSQ